MSKLTNNLAETAENYFDNSLLEITDTIFEEILKAIPLASSGLAIYNVFKSYTERQKLKNILEFIKEGEKLKSGTLFKIFSKQNNLEIGSELLNALDKTYLVLQFQMLARIAILYDVKKIDHSKFLRYAHIIPKFTSFLLTQLELCYRLHNERKNDDDYRIFNHECNGSGQELESLGLVTSIATAGGGDFYNGNDELIYFYENIYKNKHDRNEY
mgnify:CR=1 FL=1